MDKIQLKALAKINLGLDVLRRREDGYHEVKMIMQTIGLHDDLEIRRIKTPEIQVKWSVHSTEETYSCSGRYGRWQL